MTKIEAKKFGRDYENFFGFLFIHGLVHLKGFDHGSTMEGLEDTYLQKYYEETFNTMSTRGWEYLIEDFEEILGKKQRVTLLGQAARLNNRYRNVRAIGSLYRRPCHGD